MLINSLTEAALLNTKNVHVCGCWRCSLYVVVSARTLNEVFCTVWQNCWLVSHLSDWPICLGSSDAAVLPDLRN